jgi:hypothetical protein
MSHSRSATAVTQAAPASTSLAASRVAASQRKLSFSSNGRLPRSFRLPPWRRRNSACTVPSSAPSRASTAIVACRFRPFWSPSSRSVVVSWIARMCRPRTSAAVRAAAVAIISSGVTRGLCKKRPNPTSPARSPPSGRMRAPAGPTAMSRARKSPPLFPGGARQTTPDSVAWGALRFPAKRIES